MTDHHAEALRLLEQARQQEAFQPQLKRWLYSEATVHAILAVVDELVKHD